MSLKKDILHFAGGIQGLADRILHLDDAILEFAWAIQGFEPYFLKFTNSKQFNALVAKRKKTNWAANAAISVGDIYLIGYRMIDIVIEPINQ